MQILCFGKVLEGMDSLMKDLNNLYKIIYFILLSLLKKSLQVLKCCFFVEELQILSHATKFEKL